MVGVMKNLAKWLNTDEKYKQFRQMKMAENNQWLVDNTVIITVPTIHGKPMQAFSPEVHELARELRRTVHEVSATWGGNN